MTEVMNDMAAEWSRVSGIINDAFPNS